MPSLGIAPFPRGCPRYMITLPQGPAPVSGVFPVGVELHLLEIRLQAIQLSPYHTGSPSTSPHTPGHDYWFPGMLFSPIHLSATGEPSDPEIHLQSLPASQGIQTERLVAHSCP